MTGQAVDWSYANVSVADIKARGYVGLIRYLSSSAKGLTQRQMDEARDLGLGVHACYETTANRAGEGYNAGAVDGRAANRFADAVGYDAPITATVDFDAVPSATNAYFDGFADNNARQSMGLGGYGGYFVVKHHLERGRIQFPWQTVAWSGGRHLIGATLYQRYGGAVIPGTDVNDVIAVDWGQFPRPPGPPLPPLPPPVSQEEPMDFVGFYLNLYHAHLHREPERGGLHTWVEHGTSLTQAGISVYQVQRDDEEFFAHVVETLGSNPTSAAMLAHGAEMQLFVNATGEAKAAERADAPSP